MFGSAATDFPGQAGASKCAFLKDGDGALGEICELAERFDNRLTLNNLRLAERYIDGTLNLLVEARWGAMDFNIVFHREDPAKLVRSSCVHHQGTPAGARAEHSDRAIRPLKHAGDANFRDNAQGCGGYRYDGVVLVNDIKPMESPSNLVPSVASFKPKDEVLGLGRNALYFAYRAGFVSFGSLVDRQAPIVSVNLSVRSYEVTDEVVEDSAKIMNGVTDDGAEIDWDSFLDAHAIDILASVRIYLMNQVVWLAVVEGFYRRFKIVNVAFGPFNF
jgi:hypothetical protein